MEIGAIQAQMGSVSVANKSERNQVSAKSAESVDKTLAPADEASASADKVEPSAQASREEVEAAVATIQDFVQTVRRSLNFSLEEGSGRVVVKVTDASSGDIIRQIPSEEALQLAENLSEVRSLLFKAEA